MFTSPAARLVLALGALSAVVLVWAALVDLGDPVAAARARIDQSVAAQDELFQLAWERVRRGPDEPAPPSGIDVILPLDLELTAPAGSVPEPADTEDPFVHVLVDAAIASGMGGDLGTALSGVEEALERDPTGPRAPEARLLAARWWSALGATVEVERHRRALLELSTDGLVEGTSIKLLSTLVAPVDAHAAHALLVGGGAPLPSPDDTWRFTPTCVLELDPWWSALRAPLEAAAPELDWDAAFRTEMREARAVATLLGGVPEVEPDLWSFVGLPGRVFALRAVPEGVRAVEIERVAIDAALRAASASAPSQVREALFGSDGSIPREERTVEMSPGSDVYFGYSVQRPNPRVAARGEIQRLRLLRGALLGLGALVLLGATLSARAMERARRLAELRSTFVASVSHDLRTPTQAILLMAETLEQDRVATEASRGRYHTQIRKEAQRLRRLVEDLLDGARIDRGSGARVERQSVDATAFFDELEASMAERADAAGAELRIVRQSLPSRIDVDPDGVRRAAWNLFENALLHGGCEDRPPHVTVRIGCADGSLEIRVEDDGPGVPARFRETVFEPFERLADRGRREGMMDDTGTGLGLAIVRALSRAHGGDATLEASEGGARFVATFRTGDDEVVA